jgi:myosin heavy subunit
MFVFLNLVLSIVYIGIAGTLLAQKVDYKEKWKTQKKENDKEISMRDQKIADVTAQLEDLKKEKATRSRELATAKKTNDDYREQTSLLQEENGKQDARLANVEDNLKTISQEIKEKDEANKRLRKENEEMRGKADDAEKEKEQALDDKARLEEEMSQAKNLITSLEKELNKSKSDLEESKILIDSARSAGVDFEAIHSPEAPVDGKVMTVSNEVNLVMISVGADDGVKKGYHFTVYRGSLYIGQIVIEDVFKDMSSARMKLETMAKSQQVLEGDNVSTRIR